MSKYLDSSGLSYFWQKIKTYVANAVKVTGVKGSAESSYRTGNVNLTADNVGAVPYNGALFTTNTFASDKYKKLYLSKIDNAFFALDKRYNVTVTYDGSDVSNVGQFFDGNYEGNNLHIEEGKTAIFTLDFSNGSGEKFYGYPYGYVYVSFYNRCIPDVITGRVYNNHANQGVGWHDITFEKYDVSTYRARQSYYGLKILEITISGSSETPYGYTSPVEIEMQIDRPDPIAHSPIVNKYTAQKLYYDLTAPKFIGDVTATTKVTTPIVETGNTTLSYFQTERLRGEGDASTYYHAIDFGKAGHNQVDFYEYGGVFNFHKHTGATIDAGDTLLGTINNKGWDGKVNNHTINADVPANAVFTDTTYGVATTSANGLMSSSDKQKLNSAITSITATDDNNGTVTINFS